MDRIHNDPAQYIEQMTYVMNALTVMLIDVSAQGNITCYNKKTEDYMGGRSNIHDIKIKSFSDSTLIAYLAAFQAGENTLPVNKELYDQLDNRWYRIRSQKAYSFDDTQSILHVISDISDHKQWERQVLLKTEIDPLTGVHTRQVGLDALNAITGMREGGMFPKQTYDCAAFIDIDNFKSINDTLGHLEGDLALQVFANVLMHHVRSNDVVCRYGGDEFMIIFNRCRRFNAEGAFKRMNSKLVEINEKKTYKFPLTFSAGLIEIEPGNPMGVSDIIAYMDDLMYKSKREKKMNSLR